MTVHSEQHRAQGMALGLNPHRVEPHQLLNINWRLPSLPAYPASQDNMKHVTMGLDDNDRYGDCGPTSVDNHNRVTTLEYGHEVDAQVADVLKLYSECTSPPFNPQTGANDTGVTMPSLMKAAKQYGLAGKKIVGYGRLVDTSDSSIKAAIALFGAVLFAVDLQVAQQSQSQGFDPTWNYKQSQAWGGHAIVAAAYTVAGTIDVISWGMRIHTTASFRQHQLDEVWVPLWPEIVKSDKFARQVNTQQLAADFKQLTGTNWPVDIPMPPTPVPPKPEPADPRLKSDAAFWKAIKPWVVTGHWLPWNRRAARLLAKWAIESGFERGMVWGE